MVQCDGTYPSGERCDLRAPPNTWKLRGGRYCDIHDGGHYACPVCGRHLEPGLLGCHAHRLNWDDFAYWCVEFFKSNPSCIPERTNHLVLENIRSRRSAAGRGTTARPTPPHRTPAENQGEELCQGTVDADRDGEIRRCTRPAAVTILGRRYCDNDFHKRSGVAEPCRGCTRYIFSDRSSSCWKCAGVDKPVRHVAFIDLVEMFADEEEAPDTIGGSRF